MSNRSSTFPEKASNASGIPLLGLSLGAFGVGLFIASRQNRKARLRQDPTTKPVLAVKPFNAHFYAFKALGIATAIVGVVAVCTIKATTWYMDVHNVDEFHAKMKPLFKNIRPKDFKDADPTAKFDWNQVIDEAERQRNTKKQ